LELSNYTEDYSNKGLERGYYLSRAYSHHNNGGGARSLNAFSDLFYSKRIEDYQKKIKNVDISTNFVMIDKYGNVGYQQTGLLPNRVHSGLYPLPGWDTNSTWKGIVNPDELNSFINPKEGFISTAND